MKSIESRKSSGQDTHPSNVLLYGKVKQNDILEQSTYFYFSTPSSSKAANFIS